MMQHEDDPISIAFRDMDACMEEEEIVRRDRRLHAFEGVFLYRHGGAFPVPREAHACGTYCRWERLAEDVAGCTESGAIHICSGDDSSNPCPYAYRRASSIVCCATGREIAATISAAPFRRVEHGPEEASAAPSERPSCAGAKRRREDASDGSLHASTRPRKESPDEIERLYREAERIVSSLLYGPGRAKANDYKNRLIRTVADKEIRRYFKSSIRSNVLPNRMQVLAIRLNVEARKRRMAILPASNDRVRHYASLAIRLWYRLKATPYAASSGSRLLFSDHVLGFLNLSTYGLVIDSVTIIEQDEFLWQHMPPISDLRFFGFAKKSITAGKNATLMSCRSAVSVMPLESLRAADDGL